MGLRAKISAGLQELRDHPERDYDDRPGWEQACRKPKPGLEPAVRRDAQAALDAHNAARKAKGVSRIGWTREIGDPAQDYAELCAARHSSVSSRVEDQGENLFWSTRDASLLDAVQAWLAQEAKYNAQESKEMRADTGGDICSYTQCMWRDSHLMGMGRAKASDGSTYIVARYSPRGNIVGEKPY